LKLVDGRDSLLTLLQCQAVKLRQVGIDLILSLIMLLLLVVDHSMGLQQDLHVSELFVQIKDALVFLCDVAHQLSKSFNLFLLKLDPSLLFNL